MTSQKSVQEVISDLKEELKDFLATRLGMLRGEMNEKVQTVKMVAPVLGTGLVLLLTAWLAFTGFVISGIAAFFPGPWAYVIAFALVTLLYGIIGGAAAIYAWSKLKRTSIKPERTLHVLEQDRMWLQTEAKTQL